MRRHISVHRATTKYFSNSFVFKTTIEKEGLPRDSTPDLGAGGPRFKSATPRPFLRSFDNGSLWCDSTAAMSAAFVLLLAFLIGFFGGLRSLTPPAIVAWGAHLGWLNLARPLD